MTTGECVLKRFVPLPVCPARLPAEEKADCRWPGLGGPYDPRADVTRSCDGSHTGLRPCGGRAFRQASNTSLPPLARLHVSRHTPSGSTSRSRYQPPRTAVRRRLHACPRAKLHADFSSSLTLSIWGAASPARCIPKGPRPTQLQRPAPTTLVPTETRDGSRPVTHMRVHGTHEDRNRGVAMQDHGCLRSRPHRAGQRDPCTFP